MNERATFATEVLPLVTREEPFSFEGFLREADAFIRGAVSRITDPNGDFPPFLVIGREGEISVIAWGFMSAEFQEQFLDRVVPATLESHDASMVALAVASHLTRGTSDQANAATRQEVVLVSVLSMSEEQPRELGIAAPIERSDDSPPELGGWAPVDEGRLAPAFARALYEGLGVEREGDAE